MTFVPKDVSTELSSTAKPISAKTLFLPPCDCTYSNQIRYYNPKSREFYYHSKIPAGLKPESENNVPESTEEEASGHYLNEGVIYSPYGYLNPSHSEPRPFGAKSFGASPEESGVAEIIFILLAILLWLYSFYRLYLVWQNTLNFSEASIQGPQGWDLLVSWVIDRINIKKIKSITNSKSKKTSSPRRNIELNIVQKNIVESKDTHESIETILGCTPIIHNVVTPENNTDTGSVSTTEGLFIV